MWRFVGDHYQQILQTITTLTSIGGFGVTVLATFVLHRMHGTAAGIHRALTANQELAQHPMHHVQETRP